MRIQPYVINALIRRNPCQIIRARRDIGRPMRSGITRREIYRIQNEHNHKAENQPQNTRDGLVRCEQDVADVQMDQCQKNPVERLHESQCTRTEGHSKQGGGFLLLPPLLGASLQGPSAYHRTLLSESGSVQWQPPPLRDHLSRCRDQIDRLTLAVPCY